MALSPKYNNEIAQPISSSQLPHGASRRSDRNPPVLSSSHAPLAFLSRKPAAISDVIFRARMAGRQSPVLLTSFKKKLKKEPKIKIARYARNNYPHSAKRHPKTRKDPPKTRKRTPRTRKTQVRPFSFLNYYHTTKLSRYARKLIFHVWK